MAARVLLAFVTLLGDWRIGVDAFLAAQPKSTPAAAAHSSASAESQSRRKVLELLHVESQHSKRNLLHMQRRTTNETHTHTSAQQQLPSTARELITIQTLMCVVTQLGGCFLVAGLWSWWSVRAASAITEGPRGADGERSCLLDNAKIMVQLFVIWGHFAFDGRSMTGATPIDSIHQQTWLHGSQVLGNQLMDMFGPFRMPLACFLSGVCSQGGASSKKIRRFVQNLVLPTLLWIFVVKPLIHDFLARGRLSDLKMSLHDLWHFQSWSGEWYLEALVLWRSSVFLFWSQLRPQIALIGMILVSCACGYYNFDEGPTKILLLDAAMGFFPYFALGYVFPFQAVERMAPAWNRERAIGAAVLALMWTGVVVPRLFPDPLPQGHCEYGTCNDANVMRYLPAWDIRLYWVRRAAKVAVEMPPAMFVLFFVVPPFKTPLTWAGPHTLYPFLFHDLAHSWERELLSFFPPPVIASWWAHLAIYLLHLPLGFVYIAAFGSSYWRRMFKWSLDPTWMHPMFVEDEQKPVAAKSVAKAEEKVEEAENAPAQKMSA